MPSTGMKTVGDKLSPFKMVGVKPGQPEDPFFDITEKSFPLRWKVIVFYPKDFKPLGTLLNKAYPPECV